MDTFKIPSFNLPRLKSEIEQLNQRAIKLKLPTVELKIHETISEKINDEILGFEYDEVFSICSVEGDSPVLEGWTLVAILDPLETGDVFIREVPGEKCPENYRNTDERCDHCHTKRKRSKLYVLRHVEHGYKQVGKNCLKDFLGHKDPAELLAYAQNLYNLYSRLNLAQNFDWGCGRLELRISVPRFVSVVASLIRKFGWVPKSAATDEKEATANLAWNYCTVPRSPSLFSKIQVTEKDVELANKSIEWAKNLEEKDLNTTYMHDLHVCCKQESVKIRQIGFLASVVQAYQKHLEKMQIRKESVSKHQGVIGSRQEFHNIKITMVKAWSNGIYQMTAVRFQDENENVFFWNASGNPEWLEENEIVNIKATVVEHAYYKDIAQTILKRVALIPNKQPALEQA